jgi:hypothetical protein
MEYYNLKHGDAASLICLYNKKSARLLIYDRLSQDRKYRSALWPFMDYKEYLQNLDF